MVVDVVCEEVKKDLLWAGDIDGRQCGGVTDKV